MTCWENIIFTENGIIEIASTFVLGLCLLRVGQYALQSRLSSGRHFWLAAVLKRMPTLLYIVVTLLALIQYMGENAIVFPKNMGMMVEELTEIIIYIMALGYLCSFKLKVFEDAFIKQMQSPLQN